MQFSCESCQATLHIGDDKVKGKRLVVRCKKCGARIHIADPALGPAPGAAALQPAPKPAPKPAPAPAPTPAREELRPVALEEPDSDTEDTRAMESDVLEKALQASKRDDLSVAGMSPAAAARPAGRGGASPEAPVTPVPAPRDPPVWFAMIGGQQTGPMSRAELGLKTATGAVSGRSYVWKEGMAGWLRGAEVPELAALFAPPPAPKSAPAPAPKPAPAAVPKPAAKAAPAPASAPKPAPKPAPAPARPAARPTPAPSPLADEFGNLSLGGDDEGAISLNLESPLHRPGVAESDGDSIPAPAPKLSPAASKSSGPGRPAARPEPEAAPSPAISADGLAPVARTEPEDEERTNVEALPLGERVHQEAVAQELFTSGENSGVSALDLAKWASSELAKKPASSPNVKRAPVAAPAPAPAPAAPEKAPAAEAPAPEKTRPPKEEIPRTPLPRPGPGDPLAGVPSAPGAHAAGAVDTTGKVLARSGVRKSRTPLILGVIGAGVVVVLVLLWALIGGEKPETPVPTEVARPSLGGSGDASVKELAKAEPPAHAAPAAAAAPAKAPPKKPAAAAAPEKAPDKAAEKTAQEQADQMKNLDNERGIGDHGPKAEAAPAAPEPAKAETGLTPQDIRKKLVENKGALQSCIDEALKKDPNLKVGKIHIATTIAPSGQVTSTKIDKPTVDESALGGCLKRATRRIVFPSFGGEAFEVDIPIQVTASE